MKRLIISEIDKKTPKKISVNCPQNDNKKLNADEGIKSKMLILGGDIDEVENKGKTKTLGFKNTQHGDRGKNSPGQGTRGKKPTAAGADETRNFLNANVRAKKQASWSGAWKAGGEEGRQRREKGHIDSQHRSTRDCVRKYLVGKAGPGRACLLAAVLATGMEAVWPSSLVTPSGALGRRGHGPCRRPRKLLQRDP